MTGRAIAAAVTPLRDGGAEIDVDAFDPLIRFLANGGIDGILALGTTGEGVLFSADERERIAELFLAARPTGFGVLVHCGAQTTADTVRLAHHAAEIGADGVAVIAPPYFPLDQESLLAHFDAAARACQPLPFYVYEFAARSGYAVPPGVIVRLCEAAPNFVGMKVSDAPFDAVRPYLLDGLEVLVGFEPLTLEAMDHGATGAVSGMGTAFPEVIAALVHERSTTAQEEVSHLREELEGIPFHAAMKTILGGRGVPVSGDVRPPLRGLSPAERVRVLEILERNRIPSRQQSPS
jgi:dihydrodipicolinate synthase/N-acetylneuraminate lyase